MSDAVEEYLKFTIAIKTDEMKRGLEGILAQIKTFDQQAKAELGQVGVAFAVLDKQAKSLQLSMTASLNALQKEMHLLSASSRKAFSDLDPNLNKANFANYIGQLVQIGQASKQAATGMERLQVQQGALANAPKPDWDAAAAAALKEAEAARKMAEEVKKANEKIASTTRSSSATVKQELDKESKAAAETGKAGKKMADDWTGSLKDMESALTGAAAIAGTALAALAAAGGFSAKAFGELEAEVNTLTAISGASSSEIENLTAKSMALGEAYGFTAVQLTVADTELARLGFTGQEVSDAIEAVAIAAKASGESVGNSGQLIAGTIRGFGLDAKDAAHVADVLAKSANVSATSFGSLQLSMKYVAPVARASNQGLEEMTAILGLLGNNMILGEQAGTSMRSMLTSLVNPSTDAKRIFDDLNFTTQDAQGKLKPLGQVFEELREKMKKFNDVGKGKMLAEIFGTEALSAAQVLMKSSKQELDKLTDALHNVDGASKETADIMQQGLNAELAKLNSKASNLAISIGKDLSPAVAECIKFLQGLLDVVAGIPEPARAAGIQIGFLAASVAALTIALGGTVFAGGKMLGMMSQIIEKAPFLGRALAMLSGPVGWTGLALGAVANIGVNTVTGIMNSEADQNDNYSEEAGKKNTQQSKMNALQRKIKAGQLDGMSREDLQASLELIKSQQNEMKSILRGERELADLKEQLATRQGKGHSAGLTEFDEAPKVDSQITVLNQKIAAKQKDLDASKDQLQRAHQTLEDYKKLEKQVSDVLSKKPTDAPGTENAKDHEADRKADQEAQKRVEALSEKHKRETTTLKTELDKQVALLAANSQKIGTIDDAKAQKLITNSENVSRAGSSCFASVYQAYKETFGDGGMFDKMTGRSGDNPIHAADAANRLAQDTKRFHEVKINAQNYKQVMANLKAASIIVYDRGAGFTNATKTYGHIEAYDPKTGMASYGKGAGRMEMNANRAAHARIFEMNTSAAGGGEDIQKMILKQQALTKEAELYKKQLEEMKGVRDGFKQGSDAWVKADKEVFAIQDKINQLGIDGIQNSAELQKKQRAEALRWAQESLSIEADVAVAKAQLTADTFDDIQASHQKALASLRSEEMGRLAEEGTTEAQKLKIKEKYAALRLVAEKAHTDALIAERERLAKITEDILVEGARAEAGLMLDGLDKDLRLSEIRQGDEERRLQAHLDLLKREKKETTDEYALTQLALTESARNGYMERERLKEQFAHKRKLDGLNDQLGQVDRDLRSSLSGQKDPETIERIQAEALQKKSKLQSQISGELWAQLETAKAHLQSNSQSKELSEVVYRLQKQMTDSERAELDLELQSKDLILQSLERERQVRKQVAQDLMVATDATLGALSHMAGLSQNIGSNIAGWTNRLEGALSRLKDINGNALTLMDLFEPGGTGKLSEALGKSFGSDKGIKGDLFSAIPGIGAAIGAFSSIGATFPQLLDSLTSSIKDNLFGDPLKIHNQAEEFKTSILQMDAEIHATRIEMAKQRGIDTFDLEKEQIEMRKELELRALAKQGEDISITATGWFGAYTPEEKANVDNFFDSLPKKREEIEAKIQVELFRIEQERLEKVKQANIDAWNSIQDSRTTQAEESAKLTPGQEDDRAAERQRRIDAVNKRFADRSEAWTKQGVQTGNWDSKAWDDIIKEQKTGLSLVDSDMRLKRLQDEAKINSEIAQTREMEINLTLKGASKEIELLREKIRLEQATLEDKMKDPSLSPEEWEAMNERRKLLQSTLDKGEKDIPQKWANAATTAALDLQSEIAKGTKTGLDDAVADYEAAIQKISEAEEDARDNLEGPQLADTLRKLGQARLNAEKDTLKKLKEIWLQEYTERLNNQKTLIQEQLELNSRSMQDQIKAIQIAMRPLKTELEDMQRLLDASRRAREAEKKVYNPNDGKANTKFKTDLAALDSDPLAWAGVKEIANTTTHDGLSTVSGKTKREGLLKEADLQELEANNMRTDERISESDYAQRMQNAQLIRAKAAEMELATADLTRTRKLELEKEWAEAYANWQKYASEAIDARYDTDDQRTQENIDLKQLALDQQQQSIDKLQLELDVLQEAAEKKIRPIDDEILRATQSTRDWAPAWAEVTAGIAAARKEAEALLAAQEKAAKSVASKSSGTSRTKTPDATHTISGTDGYYYETTSAMQGLAGGGITPDKSKYSGDKYGPVMLDRQEVVTPLRKLPELLRPWMPPVASTSVSSFSPQITISGNYIVGEFDMYQTALRAASDLNKEANNTFAGNAGRLF